MAKFESIINVFSESCEKNKDKNLCRFLRSSLSYSEVQDLVNKFTKGLQSLGVKKGTRVGIFLPNCPAFIISYYGILQTGATIINYNPMYSEEEVYHQTKDSKPDFVITLNISDLYSKIECVNKKDDVQKFKIIVGTLFSGISTIKDWLFWIKEYNRIASVKYSDSVIKFSSLLKHGSDFCPIDIKKNDIALIQYSGGTTGKPKGILLSHFNLRSALDEPQYVIDVLMEQYSEEELKNVLAILPLYHVFAMLVIMNVVIRNGFTTVLLPKFSVESLLKTIESEKINMASFVPTILLSLIKYNKLSDYDLSSLKLIFMGGAPFSQQLYESASKIFKNSEIFQGYGLSETTSIVSLNYKNRSINPSSVGHPTENTKVSIRDLDDDKEEVKLGEMGEICVSGPQVMKSYLDPNDNVDVFVDGYFKTGDVGYIDETGAINISDRIKDMILRRGFNIFPSEIEAVIRECDCVIDVAVIGVRNKSLQEEMPKAIIQLRNGMQATDEIRDQIVEYCKEKLSAIKMPKMFEFVADLPKTPIGKIDKKKLKIAEINKK